MGGECVQHARGSGGRVWAQPSPAPVCFRGQQQLPLTNPLPQTGPTLGQECVRM